MERSEDAAAIALDPEAGPASVTRPGPPLSWWERLESLADATGSTPGRIAVGGVVLAAVVLGGMWLTRPPADPVETAIPIASSTTSSSTSSVVEPTVIVVHVAGEVTAPGVYELSAAARVVDAVTAAGGVTAAADDARLNLAAPLTDGSRVYVPAVGEAEPVVVGSSPSTGGTGRTAPGGPVNLNEADESALETIPGVGPATAAAIVAHRDRIGGFTSVDQLMDVRGIGEAKLEAMRDHVTV